MTQEEIIRSPLGREQLVALARECGGIADDQTIVLYHEELERFAALVAAHEREACAKVCGQYAAAAFIDYPDDRSLSVAGNECAAAIRVRSNNK